MGSPAFQQTRRVPELHFLSSVYIQLTAIQVFVPPGNNFGITAASAENPDSFEVFKFVLSIPDTTAPGGQPYQHRPYENQQIPNNNNNNNQIPIQQQATGAGGNGIDNRLNDLQNRLQGLVGTADRLLTEIQSLSRKVDERHQDILQKLTANRDLAGQMEQRMQRIENMLQAVQKGVTDSDLKNQLHRLQDALKTSHTGVIEQLQSTSHRAYIPVLLSSFVALRKYSFTSYFRSAGATQKKTPKLTIQNPFLQRYSPPSPEWDSSSS